MAKHWYESAIKLKNDHKLDIHPEAFINNGLNQYYMLLGNAEDALKCLDVALEQRRSLGFEEDQVLPQHIVNTHSNKIRIYLQKDVHNIHMAEAEYDSCMQEEDIEDKLRTFPDAEQRILTDHGDILNAIGKYDEAFEEYKKALSYRKYLHFIDDFTVAELYWKMGQSLNEIPNRLDESLEYMIQAYVILEKMLGENNDDVKKMKESLQELRKKLYYKEEILEQHLAAQRIFLNYRYDERLEDRENELIQYFEL